MISKNINRVLTALTFIVSLTIYIMTMAPTTSFWDCGEFISTSYILGVPHPPGSPLYLLIGNVFSSVPFFADIGARINLISPIVSALSVMFLYLIIVYLIEEYNGTTNRLQDIIIVYGSAFIGALTFAVTDSHWFNAVEAEVYSLSTFFTSIVVWMILKWSRYKNDDWNIKYLLIIIYMFGLAIGVHLLNLLTIPFVFLIIYFKKFKFSYRSLFLVICLTILSFIAIYIGIIKGIPDITNKIGNMYFMIFFFIIVIGSIIFIQLCNTNHKYKSYSNVLSIITCFSCLFLIINALFFKDINQLSIHKQNILIDTQGLIDEYDKEIYKLNNSFQEDPLYQNRTQQEIINNKINSRNNLVDEFRVLYEDYFNYEKVKNQLSFFDLLKWQPKYNLFIIFFIFSLFFFFIIKFTNKNNFLNQSIFKFLFSCILLILIGYSSYFTIFIRAGQHPSINENNPDNIDRALAYMNRDQYGDWEILNWESTIARSENTNWKRYTFDKNNPTLREQFNFFINYQINEMYLRYFAWQFIGRGDKNEFPWYIKDLNGNLIGNQQLDGINWFRYGIPLAFILGIFGLFMHFKNDWRRALSVLSLFLITGLMIIIYLNQYDPQPRERDYSYVGSFFAFSIWIGIGLSSLLYAIKGKIKNSKISTFISIPIMGILFLSMPVKMFATDYFQHSRKGNYVAWDYGYNLLNSCEPNGIIFTNGDNDTFPLWYLQEVESIRKDVKVVNLSLLNTPWYIEQLMEQIPMLNLDFSGYEFENNIYLIDPYLATESTFDICNQNYNDEIWNNLECSLNIGNQTINFNLFPTLIKKLLRVQDFMILKIIHDIGNTRPIYFAATVSDRNQIGLQDYLLMEGMTYRLNFSKNKKNINNQKMKQNLTESDAEYIIYSSSDYNNLIDSGKGVYRYTNLNDTNIYFSGNIQRLVQNYRIGFIRLAQEELLSKNNNKNEEAEGFINLMNKYFPEKRLPIEPGIALLVSDSIYAKTGNIEKQKQILYTLFEGHIPIETKIYLLHKFADLDFQKETLDIALRLIEENNKQLDFELQKYLGDILSDYIIKEDFISFCDSVLNIYPLKGILYSMIRVYEENGEGDKALEIVKDWVIKFPDDDEVNQLHNYLLQVNSIQ